MPPGSQLISTDDDHDHSTRTIQIKTFLQRQFRLKSQNTRFLPFFHCSGFSQNPYPSFFIKSVTFKYMAEIQKSESSYSSGVSDLPSSLIYEILVKLPIKSVIRCRCVCKNWNDLISDTHFATRYFKNPPFIVLVKFKNQPVNGSSCFIEIELNGDMTCTPFNSKAMNFQTSETLITKVKGSCNGLLCLVQSPLLNWNYDFNNEVVYIINPLLGEVIMLPQVNQSKDMASSSYGFGFGFSTHNNHYKVLRVANRRGRRIRGEILTIGVDHKWRSFEDSSLPLYIFSCGINLNGVIYLVGDSVKGYSYILAFDMEEERGHRIPLPSEFGDKPRRIVLALCNDNLCLSDNNSEHQVVIWTMKRYGVVESWSREIILKCWIPHDLGSDRLVPVTTLRNGDLLMSRQYSLYDISKVLISYSPKTNKCRTHEFSDGEEESSYFFVYVPSFLSLSTIL